MKLITRLFAFVFLLLTLTVASAGAQVNSTLTVAKLKNHCTTRGPVGSTRNYLNVVFTFFETGNVKDGAAARGMSTREFSRQLQLGFAALPNCARNVW